MYDKIFVTNILKTLLKFYLVKYGEPIELFFYSTMYEWYILDLEMLLSGPIHELSLL